MEPYLTLISLFAIGLVLAGELILIGSLVPLWRLIRRLPSGPLRDRWYLMAVFIAMFIFGYLAYAVAFWGSHSILSDLIVPSVFFFGACFVLLVTTFSLRTAIDLVRISHLERDVATDSLTRISNRRYMDRRLREEIASAWRYSHPLAILMFDIDHFKQINDRYGHQAGDQVLITLAEIVTEELREGDVLTRYGGEEFLIIAPHTSLSGAAELAERVRQSIEAHDFHPSNELDKTGRIKITISIGVASIGNGTEDKETLIHAADENLLRAKQEGRNRVLTDTLGATTSSTELTGSG